MLGKARFQETGITTESYEYETVPVWIWLGGLARWVILGLIIVSLSYPRLWLAPTLLMYFVGLNIALHEATQDEVI